MAQTMTPEEMLALVEKLRAENAALRTAKAQTAVLTCKVSEKGAVSVYGLGKWPVTLYREQWDRLAENMPKVKAFMAAHASELSSKADKA